MPRFSRKSRKSGFGRAWLAYPLIGVIWLGMAGAHKAKLPENLEDICTIFDDRRDWYRAARKSETRWGTPAHIQMAIIQQESSFKYDARPPRQKLMGLIPWKRPSNAYGFAQALDGTWERYRREADRPSADRDDFADAIDFVGWYTNLSSSAVGISKWDPYNQYLAYHEGQAGWQSGTYKQKGWLRKSAQHVNNRAERWATRLESCQDELNKPAWKFWS